MVVGRVRLALAQYDRPILAPTVVSWLAAGLTGAGHALSTARPQAAMALPAAATALYRARLGKAADHAAEAEVREDRLVFHCVAPVLGEVSLVLAVRPSLSSSAVLAWTGRECG